MSPRHRTAIGPGPVTPASEREPKPETFDAGALLKRAGLYDLRFKPKKLEVEAVTQKIKDLLDAAGAEAADRSAVGSVFTPYLTGELEFLGSASVWNRIVLGAVLAAEEDPAPDSDPALPHVQDMSEAAFDNMMGGGEGRASRKRKTAKAARTNTPRAGVAGVAGVVPEADGTKSDPGSEPGSGVAGVAPGFTVDDEVVWFTAAGGEAEPVWVCSRLEITAATRNERGEQWGRLLEFADTDGRHHEWACPMEMLAGDGTEFRAVLLSMGLRIAPGLKARQLLAQYVLTTDPGRRAICVERLGWHNGVYVLPDGAVGPAGGERVLFQTGSEPPRLEKAGTLAGWRDRVAAPCVGNSRLVLAISAAFAAPLLEITKGESGGMHLVGHSSTGKTTALRVAASVWGGPEYVNRWRATANGLEAVAQSRNDALLVLDELAQVNPREAGEVAYMLANGSGKHRAQRNGLARRAASWRLLFLSAGEIGLAEHMREGGKTMRAGQEIRLVDLPADAEAGRGIFDTLNGRVSAAVLADELIAAVGEEYGTAAREFLSKLALLPREEVLARVRQLREDFLKENVPAGADGQASRVAARFALVAAGGLMATDMDITGWGPEEGIQAAAACYQAWLDRRGGAGATEEMEALKTVRLFLNLHGESRFTDLDRDDPHSTVNRAGFRRKGKRGIEYLFLTEVFNKEVCKGLDHRSVLRTLRDQGWLKPDDPDRYTAKRNGLEGPDSDGRYYLVRPDLGGDDED